MTASTPVAADDPAQALAPDPPRSGATAMTEPVSVVAELGLMVTSQGDTVSGWADVVIEACVPKSETLRSSVIATWADVVTGAVAGSVMNPRIPLTLDLEVQLMGRAHAGERLFIEAAVVKAGRTVVVCEAVFRTERKGVSEVIAVSLASFMASPDPNHVFDGGFPDMTPLRGRLEMPLAERIGARTLCPGIAEVPRRLDGLNAVGAIQGGLIVMAAEEAAMSLASSAESPTVPYSLNIRYLRPILVGPCLARASGDGRASVVRLTDVSTGKICAIATVRLGPT